MSDGKVPCSHCGAGPFSPGVMRVHMSREHQPVERLVCKVCSLPFDNRDELRAHVMRSHPTHDRFALAGATAE